MSGQNERTKCSKVARKKGHDIGPHMELTRRPTIIYIYIYIYIYMHSNYEFCNWKLAAELLMTFCVHCVLIVFVESNVS